MLSQLAPGSAAMVLLCILATGPDAARSVTALACAHLACGRLEPGHEFGIQG